MARLGAANEQDASAAEVPRLRAVEGVGATMSERADTPRTAAGQRWWKALGGLPDDGAYIAAIEAEAAADSLRSVEPAAAEPPDQPPWAHPYESKGESMACIHCGWVGSYAHTAAFYQKWVFPALRAAQPPRGSANASENSLPDRPIDPNIALNRPMPLGGSLTATEPPLYCDHGRPIGPPCSECAAGLTATEPPDRGEP